MYSTCVTQQEQTPSAVYYISIYTELMRLDNALICKLLIFKFYRETCFLPANAVTPPPPSSSPRICSANGDCFQVNWNYEKLSWCGTCKIRHAQHWRDFIRALCCISRKCFFFRWMQWLNLHTLGRCYLKINKLKERSETKDCEIWFLNRHIFINVLFLRGCGSFYQIFFQFLYNQRKSIFITKIARID